METWKKLLTMNTLIWTSCGSTLRILRYTQTDNNFGGTRTQKKNVHQVNALLLGTFYIFLLLWYFYGTICFFATVVLTIQSHYLVDIGYGLCDFKLKWYQTCNHKQAFFELFFAVFLFYDMCNEYNFFFVVGLPNCKIIKLVNT